MMVFWGRANALQSNHLEFNVQHMEDIKYEHYVADGNLHQCWFCGKATKDYRSFEYKQFSTKITGPYSYKEIERTTAVKMYCCKECCQKFDDYSDTSEKVFSEYFTVVALSGFFSTILCALIFGANFGKAVIIAIPITVLLIGILVGVSKSIARRKHEEVSGRMVDRLHEHPEVRTLMSNGFKRSRD